MSARPKHYDRPGKRPGPPRSRSTDSGGSVVDQRAPKAPPGYRFDAFADVRMGQSLFHMKPEDWLVKNHDEPARVDCDRCYGNGCSDCSGKGWVETAAGREAREEWEDGAYDRDRGPPHGGRPMSRPISMAMLESLNLLRDNRIQFGDDSSLVSVSRQALDEVLQHFLAHPVVSVGDLQDQRRAAVGKVPRSMTEFLINEDGCNSLTLETVKLIVTAAKNYAWDAVVEVTS